MEEIKERAIVVIESILTILFKILIMVSYILTLVTFPIWILTYIFTGWSIFNEFDNLYEYEIDLNHDWGD